MSYKLSELIKLAEAELRRLGFTESTIKDHYSKYWHIMLTDIGNKEASKDDFIKACISHYGVDIINAPFNELTTYHSRMKSKALCLLSFQEKGFITGKPYSSRPKQILSEDLSAIINDYLNDEKHKGNSISTIEGKRNRISSFLSKYSLDSLSTDDILSYVESFKDHERIGARAEMSVIKSFLEFSYKNGYTVNSYGELFPKFRIRTETSRGSSGIPVGNKSTRMPVNSRFY